MPFIVDIIKYIFKGVFYVVKKVLSIFITFDDEEEEEVEVYHYIIPNKIIGGYFWISSSRIIKPCEGMNPGLITHLYFAFLEVQHDGTLEFQNEERTKAYCYPEEFRLFKEHLNPNVKLLFSVVSSGDSFSVVVADKQKRENFIKCALHFIMHNDFDGLDLDWEFPKAADKENFAQLLIELHEAFQGLNLLLTAAVRAIPIYDDSGYDIPVMIRCLDIFNVMTYDYYGAWSEYTGFNAPLYSGKFDSAYEKKYLSVASSVENWLKAGVPKEKICIGLPFYGRTFLLQRNEAHGVHAPVLGAGKPAALTYYQIMKDYNHWERVWDDEQKAPYKFNIDQWLAYDDEESIREKVKYMMDQDLGGVFIWQICGDDLEGDAQTSHGTKQYLLTKIYQQIIGVEQQKPLQDPDNQSDESDSSSDVSIEQVVIPAQESSKDKKSEKKENSQTSGSGAAKSTVEDIE